MDFDYDFDSMGHGVKSRMVGVVLVGWHSRVVGDAPTGSREGRRLD